MTSQLAASAEGPGVELSLLLRAARTNPDNHAIAGIAPRADEAKLLALARRHGVAPLVWFSLDRAGLGSEDVAQFKDDFRYNRFNCRQLCGQLARAADRLNDAHIRSVAFKGAALATRAYPEVWLRQFSDNDLMVAPADIESAVDALAQAGYRPGLEMSPAQRAEHLKRSRFAYSLPLFHEDLGTEIDLHWRIAEEGHPAFPARLNEPWRRLVTIEVGGSKVETFGAEDSLLSASAHAAKHAWSRLKWICDVAELLRAHPDLDWDDALACASESGPVGERTLLTSLRLAHELLEAPLPDEIRRRCSEDSAVEEIARQSARKLADADDDWPLWWPRSFASDELFLRMLERRRDRFRYFARFCALRAAAPDAKDREAVALPPRLSFLYFALRPLRLIREYGLSPLWKLLGLLGRLPRWGKLA